MMARIGIYAKTMTLRAAGGPGPAEGDRARVPRRRRFARLAGDGRDVAVQDLATEVNGGPLTERLLAIFDRDGDGFISETECLDALKASDLPRQLPYPTKEGMTECTGSVLIAFCGSVAGIDGHAERGAACVAAVPCL